MQQTVEDHTLKRIQHWYQTNCNNDWEHGYGFSISTVDNPGYTIKIDLTETCLEHLVFERKFDNGTFDWMFIQTKDKVFEAHCDPTKLTDVLKIFLDEVIPNHAESSFLYQVYIPLIGAATKLWRPVNAKMLTEDTLEIVDIPILLYEDIRAQSIDDINFSKDDIHRYKSEYLVGEKIKTGLIEMFNGVTLIVKQQ